MKQYFFYPAVIILLVVSSCNKELKMENTENSKLNNTATLITLKSGVVIEKKGNDYIWMGDISLSATQLKSLDETGTIFKNSLTGPEKTIHPVYDIPMQAFANDGRVTKSVGVYPTPYNLWAMVRYTIAPDLTWDRVMILNDAIAHWEANTNIRFYNATGQPTIDPTYGFAYPYVEFVNATVNQSSVGRIGGRQEIKLAEYQPASAAIHEIGHAIGLFHEMCRNDRDTYVNINTSNLKPGMAFNFQKVTSNYYMLGGLDFESIMMYPSLITDPNFVYDTTIPTITRKDGTGYSESQVLSSLDRSWANSFYLPYKARLDTYRELADVVYKQDNTIMTPQERLDLQAQLNNGNPYPPS